MKYRIIYILSFLLIASACSESLIDIKPENSVTKELALKKVAGIDALLRSAYRRMHEFEYYGQTHILNADALADNLVIANNTGRYTGQVVNSVGAHNDLWTLNAANSGRYPTINDCNIAIKYVDAAEGTDAVKAKLKGEALFLRALVYHDLVKTYGYEPGKEVNSWTEGVILRTNPTEVVSDADLRPRTSVEEIYTQIETDLLAAIDLLPNEEDLAAADRVYRASKASAQALLARVYLYWSKYDKAAEYADLAVNGTLKSLTTPATYVASWSSIQHPESIFELEIRSADWSTVDGVNSAMASITNSLPTGVTPNTSQFTVAGSDELIASFETGDIRRNMWVDNAGDWECKKWPGEKGDFLENIPVIRVSEMYLIQAEALAKSGDEGEALDKLNELRANRGLDDSEASGQELLDLILNEWRVEFCFEGHRFYDLKRNGLPITKPAAVNTNTLPYTDYRLLAPLPTAEVVLNTLLKQNPNY